MAGLPEDISALKAYVGKSIEAEDVVTAAGVARLAATFGIEPPAAAPGDPLPPGWHAPFFTPLHGPQNMREDGQPAGGFLPTIPLPIQRLRGESTRYPGILRIGDALRRTSEIAAIDIDETADGGPVVTLTFRQTIHAPDTGSETVSDSASGGAAVIEDRRFMYFGTDYRLDTSAPALPASADWERVIDPDPVTMFRFSAVRFNSHRIHYDRDYTVNVEGHPGLIVQGTMINHLLVEMACEHGPGAPLARFDFRIHKPIYDTGPFTLRGAATGDGASFWALDADGVVSMTADAVYRS